MTVFRLLLIQLMLLIKFSWHQTLYFVFILHISSNVLSFAISSFHKMSGFRGVRKFVLIFLLSMPVQQLSGPLTQSLLSQFPYLRLHTCIWRIIIQSEIKIVYNAFERVGKWITCYSAKETFEKETPEQLSEWFQ